MVNRKELFSLDGSVSEALLCGNGHSEKQYYGTVDCLIFRFQVIVFNGSGCLACISTWRLILSLMRKLKTARVPQPANTVSARGASGFRLQDAPAATHAVFLVSSYGR